MLIIKITHTFKRSVRNSLKPLIYNVKGTGIFCQMEAKAEKEYRERLEVDIFNLASRFNMSIEQVNGRVARVDTERICVIGG